MLLVNIAGRMISGFGTCFCVVVNKQLKVINNIIRGCIVLLTQFLVWQYCLIGIVLIEQNLSLIHCIEF